MLQHLSRLVNLHVALALACGYAPACLAQTPGNTHSAPAAAPPAYTIAQTIQMALNASSDLQIAARNVQIDQTRGDEAAAAARPNLTASANANRYDQATRINFNPQTPPVEVLKSHSEQLTLALSDRLDLTGQIRAAADQARLQSLADQFNYVYVRNQRILRAKTIYLSLLRAQHQVQVAEAALNTARSQLALAQALHAGQVGQKIDVYRAATQVAASQQQVTAANNSLAVAQASFNDLVGKPLDAPVQAVDVSGVTVGVDVSQASTVGAGLPATPFTVAPAEVAAMDVGRSLRDAAAQRPEILAAQVNVRVAQTGITLARAGLEPGLTLNAAGDYFPTTSFQTPRQRTAFVGATLTLPLYDGGATRDRIAEARLRTQNAQTTLESQQSAVALDVRQTYLNLVTAANQIDAANTALQQAIAARQLAQIRFEGQVGLYLEVTDAQSALVQAENSQVNAVYDYLIARAQFENAIGSPQTQGLI